MYESGLELPCAGITGQVFNVKHTDGSVTTFMCTGQSGEGSSNWKPVVTSLNLNFPCHTLQSILYDVPVVYDNLEEELRMACERMKDFELLSLIDTEDHLKTKYFMRVEGRLVPFTPNESLNEVLKF